MAMNFCIAAVLFVATLPAIAQETGGTASAHDISGYWELRYDSERIPNSSLTPKMLAMDNDALIRHDIEAIRWCNNLGVPALLAQSPLDIRESPNLVAMVAKAPSSVRYIYTDGRPHPAKDDYDPTTNGHAIAHWEGDTLVVDTVGFNDIGITRIPGGGIRTPDSHLVERYRLFDGGRRLSVTFIWDDANVFTKPHTYEFRYYRVGHITEPRTHSCDALDEDRAKFLTLDSQ